jgi:hypothetical protein
MLFKQILTCRLILHLSMWIEIAETTFTDRDKNSN